MNVKSRPIQVGLVQMACRADVTANLAKAKNEIEALAKRGAQVICLQELFRSLYFCQTEDHAFFDLAEPIQGPSTDELGALAQKLGVVIIASLFERRAPGLYHNTAVVIDADGKYLGQYRKMHIPDDPQFLEKFYFTPGDLGYPVFQTRFAKIGVLVCWDQWYPEAARAMCLHGAEILFYPTAIGWLLPEKQSFGAKQHHAWRTAQVAHAIANGVHVVSVNRVGVESNIEFYGASFVSDPFGEILHQSPHDREDSVVVTCDLAQNEITRQHWPFLRDRRIDSYSDLLKRWGN